ncbi:uncharacterized protein ACNLHF_019104 isoform 1-T2 [Anomaloglossus baeobatrachus]|uniref:uncharacterized protein LOC142309990 n=1 Tax=Anomaloglossus baeobatrachus TaxID=238106 RepID=UPI003F5018A8
MNKILQDIDRGLYKIRHNYTPEEDTAIRELQNNKSIIIKPADKGGSIVILDKTYYLSEIYRQLRDNSTYLPVPRDPTPQIRERIRDTVDYHLSQGTIDKKLAEYLIKSNPVTPVFYVLPKIHKNLQQPPGRPIVASTESILSPLAISLDKILTPLIPVIPSYLKDTSDFLSHIRSFTSRPPDCLLVTFDVDSLYTSIAHSDGIQAVKWFLELYGSLSPLQHSFCLDLLQLVLGNNFFLFEDQFYMQQRGTAMGSNVAPPYANIYMAHFEDTFVYSHSLWKQHAIGWRRYIDDIFVIWHGDSLSLDTFHQYISSARPGLTFTVHSDPFQINFLDTLVILSPEGTITTDLYVKPTDKNSLLLYSSCHPPHIKKSLPISQHKRVERIVSDPQTQATRFREMGDKFLSRGYPSSVAFNRSTRARNDDVISPRMHCVQTYHPFSPLFKEVITRHWPLLQKAYPSIKEFGMFPIFCHKRARNLRDSLIRADIGSSISPRQTFLGPPKTGSLHYVISTHHRFTPVLLVVTCEALTPSHHGGLYATSHCISRDSQHLIVLYVNLVLQYQPSPLPFLCAASQLHLEPISSSPPAFKTAQLHRPTQ